MTSEQVTIFLQITRPEPEGDFLGVVMQDGEETTRAWANAPSTSGIFHWLHIHLGLRPVDRLFPSGKWKPGNPPSMGLFEVTPINE